MPPAAMYGIGAVGSAVGSYMANKNSNNAGQMQQDLLYPTMGGRTQLGLKLYKSLYGGDFGDLTAGSQQQFTANRAMEKMLSPQFMQDYIMSQDPRNTFSGLESRIMGGFGGDMRDIGNYTSSEFGGKYGLRRGGSSELGEQVSRLGSDQAMRLRGQTAQLFPQLQANFNNALGIPISVANILGSQATQRAIASVGAGSQFLNNIWQPQQYTSGSGGAGAAFSDFGKSAQLWPLYQSMMGGGTTTTTGSVPSRQMFGTPYG